MEGTTMARLDARSLNAMTLKNVRSLARRLNATPVRIHATLQVTFVVKHWRILTKQQLVHAMIRVVEDIKRRLEEHETKRRCMQQELSSEPVRGTVFHDATAPSVRITVSHVNRNGSLTCWPIGGRSKAGVAMISLRRAAAGQDRSSYVSQGTTWVRCLSSAAALANKD
jgi:hypothetical protein